MELHQLVEDSLMWEKLTEQELYRQWDRIVVDAQLKKEDNFGKHCLDVDKVIDHEWKEADFIMDVSGDPPANNQVHELP